MRALDDLVQLLGPAGQADAQLGQQQPEALPVGAPHDARDQVRWDRRARALDRDGPALRDLLVSGADLAVDVVLADQRLVADAALGVRAQGVEAGLLDLDLDADLVRLRVRQLELVDRARANAADLQIASASIDDKALPKSAIKLDPKQETLTIAAPNELSKGAHTLALTRDCRWTEASPPATKLTSHAESSTPAAGPTRVPFENAS